MKRARALKMMRKPVRVKATRETRRATATAKVGKRQAGIQCQWRSCL